MLPWALEVQLFAPASVRVKNGSPATQGCSRNFYEIIGYIVFFGNGMGPVVWLLISEVYPTKIRGKAMSLATLSVWGANWVVAGTFLSLTRGVGPAGTLWIFAAICLQAFVFCFTLVPETKGKTL